MAANDSVSQVLFRQSRLAPLGSASAFPRHASLIAALVLISRVSFARRLSARIASRMALAGTTALTRVGWLRREGRVFVVNLVHEEVCARTLVALDAAACALGSSITLRVAQVDDLRPNPGLPLRAYCHPAREQLKRAHALAVIFDVSDRRALSLAQMKDKVMRAVVLADRHRRRLPLLLLCANCGREGSASVLELSALLGPHRASAPPWEVCRLLYAGRRSASSPFRLLPDELVSAIALRLSAGSAWGSEFALPAGGGAGEPAAAAMCCWESLSSTLLVGLPSSPEGAPAALAHASAWLAAQLEQTAALAWSGPQPMGVEWVPSSTNDDLTSG